MKHNILLFLLLLAGVTYASEPTAFVNDLVYTLDTEHLTAEVSLKAPLSLFLEEKTNY